MKKITNKHRSWLVGVYCSTFGNIMPLETFGITSLRLEILESLGLIEYKNGFYILTELGHKEKLFYEEKRNSRRRS